MEAAFEKLLDKYTEAIRENERLLIIKEAYGDKDILQNKILDTMPMPPHINTDKVFYSEENLSSNE